MQLRRPTLVAVALAVGCIAGPALLFGLILDPGDRLECSTHLADGTYADALVPVYVASFAILAVATAWLAAKRSPEGRVPPEVLLGLAVLAAILVAALLSTWVAALAGAGALVALVPLGLALAINGVLRLVRRGARGEVDWEDRARRAQWLLWGALALGVPASYTLAYLNGADLFCF